MHLLQGACASGPSAAQLEAQRLAEEIDKKNREDWERQNQKIKLLLLGAWAVRGGGVPRRALHPPFECLDAAAAGCRCRPPCGWTVASPAALLNCYCCCLSARRRRAGAGPGESGKSTVFKQMKLIYGVGFTDDEKAVFTHVVHNNVISSMRALIQATEDLGYETKSPVRSVIDVPGCRGAETRGVADGAVPMQRGGAVACRHARVSIGAVLPRQCHQDDIESFREVPDEHPVDGATAELIRRLWSDPGIQAAFVDRHKFQLNDSAP